MNALTTVGPRLSKLVLLLSSDKPGEIVAAATAIGKVLRNAGLDWHTLAAALGSPRERGTPRRRTSARTSNSPSWSSLTPEQRTKWLDRLASADWLTPWETEFATSIRAQLRFRDGASLSLKQRHVLDRLLAEWNGGRT